MNYLEKARRALLIRRGRLSPDGHEMAEAAGSGSDEHRDAKALPDASTEETAALEIRVPFLTDSLFFVLHDIDIPSLLNKGVTRGRIWTVNELIDLLNIPDVGPSGRRAITLARAWFDGEIVDVVRREKSERSEISPPPWPQRKLRAREKREKRGKVIDGP